MAGYSWGERCPRRSLTHGRLDENAGSERRGGTETAVAPAQPGDAGGPVLDNSGAVLGMLLPAGSDPTRQLPQGVSFAASAPALSAALVAGGIIPAAAMSTSKPTPDACRPGARDDGPGQLLGVSGPRTDAEVRN